MPASTASRSSSRTRKAWIATVVERVEDNSNKLTLTLLTDGLERTLVLDNKDREMVASEGWSSLVDFVPKFYRGGSASLTDRN